MNIYECEICNYQCSKKSNIDRHYSTKRHIELVAKQSGSVDCSGFLCEPCGFRCVKKTDYNRHITTKKHIQITQQITSTTSIRTEMLSQIVQQNEQIIQQLLEERHQNQEQYVELLQYCKEPKHITHNRNHFNLNFFLNDTCKDAVNMTDFIQNLEIQIEDVENVARLGFVEGITQILMKRLNALDVHRRPIHCMDTKRDVLYIKDDNRWEKDEENIKLKGVIETVEQRNCRKLCCDMKHNVFSDDETTNERYMHLLHEINGGGEREKKHDKIVKNIARLVTVERL